MTHRERYLAACAAQELPVVEISRKTAAAIKKWDAIIDKSKYRPKVKRAPAVRKAPVRKAPKVAAVPKVAPVLVWTVCKKCGLADAA